MTDDTPHKMVETSTNYVSDPIPIGEGYKVGFVVFGREGREDGGADIINEDDEVVLELTRAQTNNLSFELAGSSENTALDQEE